MLSTRSTRTSRFGLLIIALGFALFFASADTAEACGNHQMSCNALCGGASECDDYNVVGKFNSCVHGYGNTWPVTNDGGGDRFELRAEYIGGTCNRGGYTDPRVRYSWLLNSGYENRTLRIRIYDSYGSVRWERWETPIYMGGVTGSFVTPPFSFDPAVSEAHAFVTSECISIGGTGCLPNKNIAILQCFRGCASCVNNPSECDDGNTCTTDECFTFSGCRNTVLPDGESCNDGDICTERDKCQSGVCVPNRLCEGTFCKSAVCTSTGCQRAPQNEGMICDDDGVACTDHLCEAGKCERTKIDSRCDDASVCTTDKCRNQGCDNEPISCDDGNTCTADGCHAVDGCFHATVPGCCGNGIVERARGEECDDGNQVRGDECSETCQLIDYRKGFTLASPNNGKDFGAAVGTVGLGRILVGAPGERSGGGRAYEFERSTGTLLRTFEREDPINGERYGASVSGILGDTLALERVFIGGPCEDCTRATGKRNGKGYLYDGHGELVTTLTRSPARNDDDYGRASAWTADNQLLVGTPRSNSMSGRVYLYDRDGNELGQLQKPARGNDRFGRAIAPGAGFAFIGAMGLERVQRIDLTSLEKVLAVDKPRPPDNDGNFGRSVHVWENLVAVGAPVDGGQGVGRAYLFDADSGEQIFDWKGEDLASGDKFGQAVLILDSSEGPRVAVGAPKQGAGVVYIYDALTGGLEQRIDNPDSGGEGFGAALTAAGFDLVIGAPSDLGDGVVHLYEYQHDPGPTCF